MKSKAREVHENTSKNWKLTISRTFAILFPLASLNSASLRYFPSFQERYPMKMRFCQQFPKGNFGFSHFPKEEKGSRLVSVSPIPCFICEEVWVPGTAAVRLCFDESVATLTLFEHSSMETHRTGLSSNNPPPEVGSYSIFCELRFEQSSGMAGRSSGSFDSFTKITGAQKETPDYEVHFRYLPGSY